MRFLLKMLFLIAFSFTVNSEDNIVLTTSNHITIVGKITKNLVDSKKLEIAKKLSKFSNKEPFYVFVDSEGGEIASAAELISFIKAYEKNVKTISSSAYSAAYIIVQNLGERLILPEGTLMQHRTTIQSIGGSIPGELNSRIEFVTKFSEQYNKICAKRVGLDFVDYQKLIKDELWLISEDAVKFKHADNIVTVRCDKELIDGYYWVESDRQLGVTISTKFSLCPLIKTALENKVDMK